MTSVILALGICIDADLFDYSKNQLIIRFLDLACRLRVDSNISSGILGTA